MKYLILVYLFSFNFLLYSQNKFENNKGVNFEVYQKSESEIKTYLENNLTDPIEGIWSISIDGVIDQKKIKLDNFLKIAILKDTTSNNRDFIEIILPSNNFDDFESMGWKPYYITAFINRTSLSNMYIENSYKTADDLNYSPKSINWIMEDLNNMHSSTAYFSNGIEYNLKALGIKTFPLNQNKSISNDKNTQTWNGNGTGFFIDKNGYIATNYHVVKDAKEIEVEITINGDKKSYPVTIIASDVNNDVSIIKIEDHEFKPFTDLPYNLSIETMDVGSEVFTLGYPMELSLLGTEIKFTDGKINSKSGVQNDKSLYQISTPIQPGNSGGPLFDSHGNIIGITTSGINRELDLTENVNYALKAIYLKNLVNTLDFKLNLPNNTSLASKPLTSQIKILSNYVVLVKFK